MDLRGGAAGDQPCLSRPEARSDRICQQRDRAHWKATVAFALPVPTIVLLTNGPHLFHAPYFTSLAKPRRSACPRAHVLPTRPTTSTHFIELSHVLSITVLRRHALRYGHCGITVETTRPRIGQDLDVPLGAHDLCLNYVSAILRFWCAYTGSRVRLGPVAPPVAQRGARQLPPARRS